MNLKSKRFLFAAMVGLVWFGAAIKAVLSGNTDVLNTLNPYCLGYLATYSGWESWKPTGLTNGGN